MGPTGPFLVPCYSSGLLVLAKVYSNSSRTRQFSVATISKPERDPFLHLATVEFDNKSKGVASPFPARSLFVNLSSGFCQYSGWRNLFKSDSLGLVFFLCLCMDNAASAFFIYLTMITCLAGASETQAEVNTHGFSQHTPNESRQYGPISLTFPCLHRTCDFTVE